MLCLKCTLYPFFSQTFVKREEQLHMIFTFYVVFNVFSEIEIVSYHSVCLTFTVQSASH